MGVISILFEMLGLFGAYKEKYCLTLAYAIVRTLATVGSLVLAILGQATRANLASFVVGLLITVLAYVFAMDLNQIKKNRNSVVLTQLSA